MERIIRYFRIANNLSPMETVRITPFYAGHCPDMELGNCDLSSNQIGLTDCSGILLFSPFSQAVNKLDSASVSLRPSLVLKSRRCKCRPYFAPIQNVVFY